MVATKCCLAANTDEGVGPAAMLLLYFTCHARLYVRQFYSADTSSPATLRISCMNHPLLSQDTVDPVKKYN